MCVIGRNKKLVEIAALFAISALYLWRLVGHSCLSKA